MPERHGTGKRVGGDPRKAGGNIAGPGGWHDHDAVIIDITDAVLMDQVTVSLMDDPDSPKATLAVLLSGRIHKTADTSRVLYLMSEDGAALMITEIMALASRIGPEFTERLMSRMYSLVERGAVGRRSISDENGSAD